MSGLKSAPGLRVRVASKRRCQTGEGPHWDEKAQALLYVDCFAGCISRLDPETHEDIDTIHFGKLSVYNASSSCDHFSSRMLLNIHIDGNGAMMSTSVYCYLAYLNGT